MEVGQRRVGKTENQVQGRTAEPCPEHGLSWWLRLGLLSPVPPPTCNTPSRKGEGRRGGARERDGGGGLTEFSGLPSFIFPLGPSA